MSRTVTAAVVQINDTSYIGIKWRLHQKGPDRDFPPMRLTLTVEGAEDLHAALSYALDQYTALSRAKGRKDGQS